VKAVIGPCVGCNLVDVTGFEPVYRNNPVITPGEGSGWQKT
jgi:hypothetical protein